MSTELDVQEVEAAITNSKQKIQRKQALERLEQNPDFTSLISEGFLKEHAVRQVMLKAHPGMQSENAQRMLDQQMIAIGGLKQFFVSILAEAQNAEVALEADEATLRELEAAES